MFTISKKITCIVLVAGLSSSLYAEKPKDRPLPTTAQAKDLKWGPCPDIFPKGCEVGVLNGDPAKGKSDVFLRVPANYKFPPHTHTSAEHIVILSGKMSLKYKGQESKTLSPSTYAYGPAEHPHEASCVSKEKCLIFIGFDGPVDASSYSGKL
jgi:quercetin dioxygenase-like cupin family protein